MCLYRKAVIAQVQRLGQTAKFARWALDQIDYMHYRRRYLSHELAELLVLNFAGGSE